MNMREVVSLPAWLSNYTCDGCIVLYVMVRRLPNKFTGEYFG